MPVADEQFYIHDKYVNELLQDIFLPSTRARLLEVIHRMREQEQIECVVLAGTELPLVLSQDNAAGIPLLDTTKIHVEAAVARLLS
jgi:aspartate racemase